MLELIHIAGDLHSVTVRVQKRDGPVARDF